MIFRQYAYIDLYILNAVCAYYVSLSLMDLTEMNHKVWIRSMIYNITRLYSKKLFTHILFGYVRIGATSPTIFLLSSS